MTERRDILLPSLVLLMVLAAAHGLDVQAGAKESGDLWLTGQYMMVTVAAAAAAAVPGILILRRRCSLELVFVCAATVFGILYLCVLPPLSAPDEVRHYISAYRLSNGIMGLPATGDDGKVVVREEDWFAEDAHRNYRPYVTAGGALATDEAGAKGAKVLGQMLTEDTYRLIHEKGSLQETPRAAGSNGTALSNHRPVDTTPVAYLMPALGITLARLLGLNSLWLLYLGRLFNLFLFVAATYLAMRRLPFGKEILFGVALLPMTIHLSASFSYDVMILAGIFYFTACCLNLTFHAERVRPVDILVLALIMAAVGPCKMVYGIWMGLCLMIPVSKFGGRGKWILSAACVLGAWAAAMVLVNSQIVASYAVETDNYIEWAGEAGYSVGMLVRQPVKCFQLFLNTLIWQAEYYHFTMIGAYLGHVDPVLDVPYVVVLLLTAGLLLLAFGKPGENPVLTGGRRIWIWSMSLACIGAVMFSMLLAWTPVSSKIICGVQGRYFLPFLPALLMTWKNNIIILTKNTDRSILYLMCCANAYVVFRLFSVVSMRL